MARFWLEAGISTLRCPACVAFRMRVNISAMGSVMLMDLAPVSLYQLALVTPGTSPPRASCRKQIRQMPNFLM